MFLMSIDPKKCCGTHSKEKEDNGECCQVENQKAAEAQTYEQSFIVRTSTVKELVKHKDECYPGQADET